MLSHVSVHGMKPNSSQPKNYAKTTLQCFFKEYAILGLYQREVNEVDALVLLEEKSDEMTYIGA